MTTVSRREEKYALTVSEAAIYANRFSQFLQMDQYANRNGVYRVRSLYFDTPDDADFFDKLNEQNWRKKVRLRIYQPGNPTIKLELKKKENVFQQKRTLNIRKQEAISLIEGDYSVLLNYHEPFAAEMYAIMAGGCYRPKVVIEYQRKALIARENHIRITFDSLINASESAFDLFAPTLPLHPILDPSKTILEIKYAHFVPGYISDVLSQIDRRSISTSKYCMGRQTSHPNTL